MAPHTIPGRGGNTAPLSSIRRRVESRARDREERLRGLALRLVQRSQRVLPRIRTPVVAQDTGFSGHLPTVGGFAFDDADARSRPSTQSIATTRGNARLPRASSPRSTSIPIEFSRRCWSRSDDQRAATRSRTRRAARRARRRAPHRSGAVAVLDELRVARSHRPARGRAPLALVVKDLQWASMLPRRGAPSPASCTTPAARSAFTARPRPRRTRHGALLRGRRRRDRGSWILLERVPGVPLVEVGDRESWRRAMRWLARFHARGGVDRGRALGAVAPARRAFLTGCGWTGPGGSCPTRGSRGWPRPLRHGRLASARSASDVHPGELYASNVLVDGDRVCAIDWEMAGMGCTRRRRRAHGRRGMNAATRWRCLRRNRADIDA